jgi:hypothetical protein
MRRLRTLARSTRAVVAAAASAPRPDWRYLSLGVCAILVTALVSGSNARAFDLDEVPLAIDALNTFAPGMDPPPNDGAHDYAVGGGQHAAFGIPGCGRVSGGFSAHSDPDGSNPQGHVVLTVENTDCTGGFTHITAKVTCLQVIGNGALIRSVDQQTGDEILTEVEDNGNPVMGTPPDRIRHSPAQPATLMFPCGPPTGLFLVPLDRGNIVVRDVL